VRTEVFGFGTSPVFRCRESSGADSLVSSTPVLMSHGQSAHVLLPAHGSHGGQGVTWSRQGPISVSGEPFGVIESTLWETPSGEVRKFLRLLARIDCLVASPSSDGGLTREAAHPTQLPKPCRAFQCRLQGKRLGLLVYGLSAGSMFHVSSRAHTPPMHRRASSHSWVPALLPLLHFDPHQGSLERRLPRRTHIDQHESAVFPLIRNLVLDQVLLFL
jgi:hypothetical protein